MDFGSLLYEAQRNERSSNKEPVRCYKTTFEPPKKDAKGKTLSVNIKKFLQKKEEEERRKDKEARKKREELGVLRSQDKKAHKRVQVMLKRTKSANKSVMEDAIDDVNTVVTMAGPVQPDEDDYGYVSQEASAYYNKLMDKYANMPPEVPKFAQAKKTSVKDIKEMNAAKERVRQALNRVEEEEMMPHKRKRKSKADKSKEDDNFIDDNDYRQGSCRQEVDEPPLKKPKRPLAPPPLDFNSLLKIAEQKQFEPIVIEKKVDEEERPLTKKQRMEFERENDWRMRKSEKKSESSKINTNRIPKLSESQNKISKPSESQNRIPKLSESQNRIPKLSETQNMKNSSTNGMSSKSAQNVDRFSGDARRYQRDEDNDRQRASNHVQSKPSIQFDRGRQSSHMIERDTVRTSNNIERKRQENYSGSDDDRYQENNKYNSERRNSQVTSYNDKKRVIERSNNKSAQYDNSSDNDRSRSTSNHDKPRQERKYPPAKSDQIKSSDYERSKKYNSLDERRSHDNYGLKYEKKTCRGDINRERQYSNEKFSRERSQTPQSDQETRGHYQGSDDDDDDDKQHMVQSRQNSETNRSHKIRSGETYSRSFEDDRHFTSKSVCEKSRSDYNENRRSAPTKSECKESKSPDSNYDNTNYYSDSDDDRPRSSKFDREKPKSGNQNRGSYQVKSRQERMRSPSNDYERNEYDSDDSRPRVAQSRQNSDRNKIRSHERSVSYDSEGERPAPKSNREKSRSEIQHSKQSSQVKLPRDRGQASGDRSRSDNSKVRTSEQSKSHLHSDSESDKKRIPLKQDKKKLHQSMDLKNYSTKNISKFNQRLSVDSDNEKPRVNWRSDKERVPEHQPRPRNLDSERSKYNAERERSHNINKYDQDKMFNRDRLKLKSDIKRENPNDSDYDRGKSSKNVDIKKPFENNRDKSRPSLNSQERSRINERNIADSRDRKVITVQNAEERLKKSADVWSKPCNITPPRPSLKNVNRPNRSIDRQKEGSSSSKQVENRNDYNKSKFSTERSNSPLAKYLPGTKSIKKEDSRSSSGYNDKIIVGKPGPGGKPNMMKAAAVRAAELRSQKPSLPPEKRNERNVTSKSEGSSSSIQSKTTNDIKPRQFPPNDLKPKQFPPADLKAKEFPPKDVRPKQFPPPDVKRRPKPPAKRRIIEDSEEEHDSEMDDFIDDGVQEEQDYSKYISEIFGYDKSKYSQFDEDDECMESSFAQQMKEDIRSTKIGLMEDLEDMRKEKEEKIRALKRKMVSKPR